MCRLRAPTILRLIRNNRVRLLQCGIGERSIAHRVRFNRRKVVFVNVEGLQMRAATENTENGTNGRYLWGGAGARNICEKQIWKQKTPEIWSRYLRRGSRNPAFATEKKN